MWICNKEEKNNDYDNEELKLDQSDESEDCIFNFYGFNSTCYVLGMHY